MQISNPSLPPNMNNTISVPSDVTHDFHVKRAPGLKSGVRGL